MSVASVAKIDHVPVAIARPPLLNRLWKKIREIAKKIFNFLYFWKKPEYVLSENQTSIIEKARTNARNAVPRAAPLAHSQSSALLRQETRRIELKKSIETPVDDPSLKQVLASVTRFTSVLVDCIKDEKIVPSIEGWKKDAKDLPDTAKKWVKMFMDVKEYLDPLFERFGKADEPLIMPLIQLLCTVLLENKKQEEIEEALIAKINDMLSKKVITDDLHKRLSTAIQPAIDWIIKSNNLLLKSIHPVQLHELLMDMRDFSLQFSNMLLDGSLDESINEIQTIIQEHLTKSLPDLLEKNKGPIAKYLGSELGDLIQNLPYTAVFDDFTGRINKHLDAWMYANKRNKEEKETISAAKQAVATYPPDIDQTPKKAQMEYLRIVDKAGGPKAYLLNKFINDFRDFFFLKYPDSVPMLSKPPQGMNIESMRQEIYNGFAEKIYRLLLPSVKYDLPFDINLEQDGLTEIWERTILPEKLKEIEIKLLALFDSILKNMEPRNESNFKAYFFLILKTFVFHYIRQNKILPLLQSGISDIFEKYSKPASIQELFSENIIPTATDKIFEIFARQLVSNNLEVFAPLFCSLIESPPNRVKEAKKAIITKIEEMMSGKLRDFKWEMIGRERVPSILQPIIVEITQVLQNLKEIEPTKTLMDKEVSETIKKYYASEKVENRKEFGEIINKLLFDIGEFDKSSWTGWVISFFPGTLTQVATIGFKDYRASPHPLVNSIASAGEGRFYDYHYVKSTFFSPNRSAEELKAKEEEISKKLPGQFCAIAAETHDLLCDGSAGYFVPTTQTIDSTVQKIFKKLFKRPDINQHLVFQLFAALDKGFADSVIRSACNLQLQNRVQLITE